MKTVISLSTIPDRLIWLLGKLILRNCRAKPKTGKTPICAIPTVLAPSISPAAQDADTPLVWFLHDLSLDSDPDGRFSVTYPDIYYGEGQYGYAIVPNNLKMDRVVARSGFECEQNGRLEAIWKHSQSTPARPLRGHP